MLGVRPTLACTCLPCAGSRRRHRLKVEVQPDDVLIELDSLGVWSRMFLIYVVHGERMLLFHGVSTSRVGPATCVVILLSQQQLLNEK